jgi:hypothetical protein
MMIEELPYADKYFGFWRVAACKMLTESCGKAEKVRASGGSSRGI